MRTLACLVLLAACSAPNEGDTTVPVPVPDVAGVYDLTSSMQLGEMRTELELFLPDADGNGEAAHALPGEAPVRVTMTVIDGHLSLGEHTLGSIRILGGEATLQAGHLDGLWSSDAGEGTFTGQRRGTEPLSY